MAFQRFENLERVWQRMVAYIMTPASLQFEQNVWPPQEQSLYFPNATKILK